MTARANLPGGSTAPAPTSAARRAERRRAGRTKAGAADLNPADAERLTALVPALLSWYRANARRLPWRENPTSYRVWVSEVMLQQTRVETVTPYYRRFLSELPDVPALAAVSEERLFKLWEGLGYYSRARNLRRAAQIVCARYGGRLPADFALLRALPGFGDYTAGAVASIAFGLPVPAADGNVLRVLARLLACGDDILRPAGRRRLTAAAALMLPRGAPGAFNQAMMEVGATVCLPGGAPRCARCPLAAGCRAEALGTQPDFPVRSPRKPRAVERRTLALIVSERGVLLHKRPAAGLLASLWEYPARPGWLSGPQALAFGRALGAAAAQAVPFGQARHIFTHREWQMRAYLLPCAAFPPNEGFVWAGAASLRDRFALPSAFRTFTGRLLSEGLLPNGSPPGAQPLP